MKRIIFIAILAMAFLQGQAQKETNLWYFGKNVGLNFNNLQTKIATDASSVPNIPTMVKGPINTIEGCFTLSDGNGNLLMSSDGSTVYNANNVVMHNGTGLLGNSSASQSGIVVPMPGNTDKYYIISVNAESSSTGVNYSIVDMSQQGGLGSVITKNVNLLSGQRGENIMAIPNAANDAYWLIHRDRTTFYIWKITSVGISFVGMTNFTASLPTSNTITVGYLTASPDYTKIAAVSLKNFSLVADFDNATGAITNVKVRQDINNVYKIEFSPSQEWLIIACNWDGGALYSIKLNDFISGGVMSTIYNERISCIQKHTDGRMYGTGYNSDRALFVIMNPDNGGTIVKKIANFFSSDPQWGLPTFATGYLTLEGKEKSFVCTGNDFRYTVEVSMSGPVSDQPTKLVWDFGDGSATVTQNIVSDQTIYKQIHNYATTGKYTITIIPYKANGAALSKITLPANVIDCVFKTNRMIRTDLQNTATKAVNR